MKTEPRTASFDDGFFPEFQGRVLVVGIVMRGTDVIENAVSGKINVDGDDATELIIKLVKSLPQALNAIFLDGIAFGGFNVLDLQRIYEETGVPVIAVTKARPDLEAIRKALENVPNSDAKWKRMESAGPITEHGQLCFQCKGIPAEKAKQLISSCSKNNVPEGLRNAHIIASGMTRGVQVD